MVKMMVRELCLWRWYAGVYLLFLLIAGGIGLWGGKHLFFVELISALPLTLPLSLWSYSHQLHWDQAALEGPAELRRLVRSRYFLVLLLTAAGLALDFLFSLAVGALHPQLESEALLISILAETLGMNFTAFLSFPLILVLDGKKIWTVILLSALLAAGILMLGFTGNPILGIGPNIPNAEILFRLLAIGLPSLAVMAVLSCFLSAHLSAKGNIA